MKRVKSVVYLVLRILSDAAGVQKNGVGLVLLVAYLIPRHLHDRCNHLAVGHVHLASVCLDVKLLHCLWFWVTKVQKIFHMLIETHKKRDIHPMAWGYVPSQRHARHP